MCQTQPNALSGGQGGVQELASTESTFSNLGDGDITDNQNSLNISITAIGGSNNRYTGVLDGSAASGGNNTVNASREGNTITLSFQGSGATQSADEGDRGLDTVSPPVDPLDSRPSA